MMAARRKPARKTVAKKTSAKQDSFSPEFADIGVTLPLGYYDPLGIRFESPERYRRFTEMEIKHGRLAMAATLGVIVTEAGFRWPGYISTFANFGDGIKFADIPGGAISSWAAVPELGWLQIVALISVLDVVILKQDPDKEAGDVIPDGFPWVRYEDAATRETKLNAERNNGRLAMMGIFGMLANEALTGNPLYPFNQ
jgi:light-harvesting complex I chlorophyll a/b binding protein 1